MGYTARRVAVLHHLAAWKNYKHIVLQFNEPPQRLLNAARDGTKYEYYPH